MRFRAPPHAGAFVPGSKREAFEWPAAVRPNKHCSGVEGFTVEARKLEHHYPQTLKVKQREF